MELHHPYDEYEERIGPDFVQPKAKVPLSEAEAAELLVLARRLQAGRARQNALAGGKEANRLGKELRDLEKKIVDYLVRERGCFGYRWPEHRFALQIEAERQSDGTFRAIRLVLYSD